MPIKDNKTLSESSKKSNTSKFCICLPCLYSQELQQTKAELRNEQSKLKSLETRTSILEAELKHAKLASQIPTQSESANSDIINLTSSAISVSDESNQENTTTITYTDAPPSPTETASQTKSASKSSSPKPKPKT